MNKKFIKHETDEIAIFSDLHLGVHGNSEVWHNIALEWAKWITNDLRSRKITRIFFLGDFFDNRTEINVSTLHVASQVIDMFDDFEIVMVVGNHDAFYKNRSDVHSLGLFRNHPNITLVDSKQVIDILGTKFFFVSWNNDIECNEVYDVLLGHFETVTFKMNNAKICDHGISPSSLLEKCPVVFSGHFHTKSHKTYKNGQIRYVGNTFPMDFSDLGDPKGYYIYPVRGGIENLQFVENPVSPKYQKVYYSELDTLDSDSLSGNFVKLVVDVNDYDEDKVSNFELNLKTKNVRDYQLDITPTIQTLHDVDEIESVEMEGIFDEFLEKMDIDDDTRSKVKGKIMEIYKSVSDEKGNI